MVSEDTSAIASRDMDLRVHRWGLGFATAFSWGYMYAMEASGPGKGRDELAHDLLIQWRSTAKPSVGRRVLVSEVRRLCQFGNDAEILLL